MFIEYEDLINFKWHYIKSLFLETHIDFQDLKEKNDENIFLLQKNNEIVIVNMFSIDTKKVLNYIDNFPQHNIKEVYFYNYKNHSNNWNKNLKVDIIPEFFNNEFMHKFEILDNDLSYFIDTISKEKNFDEKYKNNNNYKEDSYNLYKYSKFVERVTYNKKNENDINYIGHLNHLLNGSLKLSPPDEFNDPFDCDMELLFLRSVLTEFIEKYTSKSNIKKIKFDHILQKYCDELISKNIHINDLPLEQFNIWLNNILTDISHENFINIKPDINEISNFINAIDKTYIKFKDSVRVLCLTPKYDEILMWSYYGDEHKGLCQGYDYNDILNQINNKYNITICGNIIYNKDRPPYKKIINKPTNFLEYFNLFIFIAECCFIKYKEWDHEKEYRFLVFDEEFLTNKLLQTINCNIVEGYFGILTNPIAMKHVQSKTKLTFKKLKKDDKKYKIV